MTFAPYFSHEWVLIAYKLWIPCSNFDLPYCTELWCAHCLLSFGGWNSHSIVLEQNLQNTDGLEKFEPSWQWAVIVTERTWVRVASIECRFTWLRYNWAPEPQEEHRPRSYKYIMQLGHLVSSLVMVQWVKLIPRLNEFWQIPDLRLDVHNKALNKIRETITLHNCHLEQQL